MEIENSDSELMNLEEYSKTTGAGKRARDEAEGGPAALNLTEKTVYLMRKVSEYGYMTLEEIGLVYTNQSYAYRVVNDLKRRGLLGEFKTTKQPRKALYLKAAGYRLLEKYGKLRLSRRFHPEGYKPFIFEHRMASAKAGLILETHPLISNFKPEGVLWEARRNSDRKLCDAEFLFKAPGWDKPLRVGLEVELNLKNRDKLFDSFRDLKAKDLDQVWWICDSEGLLGSISRMISELPWLAPQQHFLCTMGDLLAQKHRLALRDSAGSPFMIDPDGATLPLPPKPEPVQVEEQAEAPQPPQPATPRIVDAPAKRSLTQRIPGLLWLRDRFRRDEHYYYRDDGLSAESRKFLLTVFFALWALWTFRHHLNDLPFPDMRHRRWSGRDNPMSIDNQLKSLNETLERLRR